MRVLAVSHSAREMARKRGTSFAVEGANGSAQVCGEGPSGAREGHTVTRCVAAAQAGWSGKEQRLRF